jgi:indolepyruvate ferredoxin oxidoreductase beta subunit
LGATNGHERGPASALPSRPVCILIAALGGEGGGVLADWIVTAATAQSFPVQATSIPGVAQRTGATTYYIEIYPTALARLGERRPVMALTPSPGNIDVMVASELVEAGRAMQNGFVAADRTTLIASTHRVYATAEKIPLGDGRADSDRILSAARSLAKRAVLFDMAAIARAQGTVINAVLFGAMAGCGAVPLDRDACEQAIRAQGRGAEASLAGFAAGYASASGKPASAGAHDSAKASRPRAAPVARVRDSYPTETYRILEEGFSRLADYQDEAYANLYLDRLELITRLDGKRNGGIDGYELTNETARFLALWMSYEDVIRVADLKSRRSRLDRIRKDVGAKPGEPMHVVEYLKPGVEEIAALLPPGLAARLVAWSARRQSGEPWNKGLYVRTTGVFGFLQMRFLAALRPLRRSMSRFREEQALIERWLDAIRTAAATNRDVALEIALCGRLIKGYGDTNHRGKENLARIMDTLVADSNLAPGAGRAAAIRRAREAALADPDGRRLEQSLASVGIAPLPPKAQPIKFYRRAPAVERKAAA